jgi:hypothetical protein
MQLSLFHARMPFLLFGPAQRCISMFQQQNPYTKAATRNRKVSAPATVVSRSELVQHFADRGEFTSAQGRC